MIKKFKAAILKKNNSKLFVHSILLKDELKKGQIFVKLKYSGICGKQIDEIEGVGGRDPYLPHLLGHEGSGVVLNVGPGVKKVKKNDLLRQNVGGAPLQIYKSKSLYWRRLYE